MIEIVFKSIGGVLIFLTSSYVVGAIAYRRSIKTPDTISSYLQWIRTKKGSAPDEIARMSVSFDPTQSIPQGFFSRLHYLMNREQWILRKAGSSIDYPYPLLRKYLCCRGLNHLADYVPWCAGCGGGVSREAFKKGICSKMYINIIKQRLRNSGHENLIMDMVRNECHIRMLGSLWHILTFICHILIFTFVFMSILVFCSQFQAEKVDGRHVSLKLMNRDGDDSNVNAWFFGSFILGYALFFFCRRSIELGFHYVRTREVAMILESAWVMDNVDFGNRIGVKQRCAKRLFEDIKDQANQFERTHCIGCKHYRRCHVEKHISE